MQILSFGLWSDGTGALMIWWSFINLLDGMDDMLSSIHPKQRDEVFGARLRHHESQMVTVKYLFQIHHRQ
jgi:hypothetical protein